MTIEPITAVLLTAILGILGFIAKKLGTILEHLIKDTELAHKRNDVSDVVHAHFLKEPFNSRAIAEGKLAWPNLFRTKPKREN